MYGVPPKKKTPAGQQPVFNFAELQKRYQSGPQNLQTGNRVYNGFSSSPHAGGGLDPSGYNTRDLEAKTKRDFLVNRLRSGGF